MSAWRPMSTAPKGERILGLFEDQERPVQITQFCEVHERWENDEPGWSHEVPSPIKWQPLPTP